MADLLALYDQHERFAATYPDTRREELPHLVRHVDLVGNSGAVIFSRLDVSCEYYHPPSPFPSFPFGQKSVPLWSHPGLKGLI